VPELYLKMKFYEVYHLFAWCQPGGMDAVQTPLSLYTYCSWNV